MDSPRSAHVSNLRVRGFPQAQALQEPTFAAPTMHTGPLAKPQALPHASKGAWLSRILAIGMGSGIIWIATVFFQGRPPTGIVQAKCQVIVPLVAGTVREVFCEEGSWVEEGQLLCSISSPELEERLHKLQQKLMAAVSQQKMAVAQSTLATHREESERLHALAECLAAEAELEQDTFESQRLDSELQRNRSLAENGVVTKEAWDELRYASQGLDLSIVKRKEAIEQLRRRSAESSELANLPSLVAEHWNHEIQLLHHELRSVERLLKLTQVRAPSAGRIITSPTLAGHAVHAETPLFEFMPLRAVEVVIHAHPKKAASFCPGTQVDLRHDNGTVTRWEVAFIAPRLEPPVTSGSQLRTPGPALLAIHCRPVEIMTPRSLEAMHLGMRLMVDAIKQPVGLQGQTKLVARGVCP